MHVRLAETYLLSMGLHYTRRRDLSDKTGKSAADEDADVDVDEDADEDDDGGVAEGVKMLMKL